LVTIERLGEKAFPIFCFQLEKQENHLISFVALGIIMWFGAAKKLAAI
jgi:hypothetical protein